MNKVFGRITSGSPFSRNPTNRKSLEEISSSEFQNKNHKKSSFSLDLSYLSKKIELTPPLSSTTSSPTTMSGKLIDSSEDPKFEEESSDKPSFSRRTLSSKKDTPSSGEDIMAMLKQLMEYNQSGGMNFGGANRKKTFNKIQDDEEIAESETFESMEAGQEAGARTPKDMISIFGFFNDLFRDAEDAEQDEIIANYGFTKAWNFGAYNKYVLGAKRQKEELEKLNGQKPILLANKAEAFVLVIGTKTQGVRSNVHSKRKIITFPDFLACITIKASFEGWSETYPAAPLAANISHTSDEYKTLGIHTFGHGGLPSVVNFFFNSEKEWQKTRTEDHEPGWGPVVADLVILASFMDDQATGELRGTDNTLIAISRTCAASSKILLDGANWEGWEVAEMITQAERTTAGLRTEINSKLKNIKKKGPMTPSTTKNQPIKRRGLKAK